MTRKIFFKPAVQVENTGDLLINKSAIELLQPHGQIIVDNRNTPEWFLNELGLRDSDSKLTDVSQEILNKAILKELIKNKFRSENKYYLVFQPGHTSRKGFKVALLSAKNALSLFLLKFLGCRIVRVGFSIGPFDTLNGWAESFTSHSFYYYALRDRQSLKLAQKFKFKNPQYFPDLAWGHAPETTSVTGNSKDYVVISFRSNAYGKVHDNKYLAPIIERLKGIFSAIDISKIKIIVAYQVKYDRDPSIEISKALSAQFNVEFIDKKLSLREAEQLYLGAKFVISNRLHVILLALQCNTLSFPLVKRNDNKKITSILGDNEIDSLILDMEDDLDTNLKSIDNILASEEKIMSDFRAQVHKNNLEIEKKLSTVFS